MKYRLAGLLLTAFLLRGSALAAESLPEQAASALKRAVEFYHGKIAVHGGYVYRYSDDLAKREGEGKVETEKVWVQPPGTPSVGMAYLEAYELLGEDDLLKAARDAAECLIQGQLRTGGWRESIEFDPKERKKFAYRVEKERDKQKNHTTFDDDKTQSAMRLLMRLDQTLKFKDAKLHEASLFALDSVVKAQFPNGGWGQGYDSFPNPADYPVKPASYPESWSRTYPGGKYWYFYTLNDNAMADTIDALLMASKIYGEPKYRHAALKGGEFLILAQMPDPQPAWAQQYDWNMHPCWARKFEPASITGGESQGAIRILLRLYLETGDKKFLAPIPKALDYLERSRLPNGQMARFYELKSNKPLYFTKTYELTYDDSDLPTHYGFKLDGKLDQLRREYDSVTKLTERELVARRDTKPSRPKSSAALEAQVQKLIELLDDRGAWVEEGQLRYHGKSDPTRRVIDSGTFIRNIGTLSRYLAAVRGS
ncbi:MAG: pectate lyase [Planctomycetaceae bacterium]